MGWLLIFVQPITWALMVTAAGLLTCIAVEYASPRTSYSLRDRFLGSICFLFYAASSVSIGGALHLWLDFHPEPLLDVSGYPRAVAILGFIVAMDFLNYWQHRFDHRFLWSIHGTHHLPRELHAANGAGHPLQAVSEFFLITIPLGILIGDIMIPMAATMLMKVQSIIQHSPTRVHMGPLRRIFVDSRFHRIHHSAEPAHFGKNFGTIFTIWDQMFGTAYFPREDEWPETGVVGLAPAKSLGEWLLMPLRFPVEANEVPRTSPLNASASE